MIGEGLYYETVGNKFDTWLKIKTKEGKTGFSYAGYITKNLNENLSQTNAGVFENNSYEIKRFVEF